MTGRSPGQRPGPSRTHYDLAVVGGGIYGAAVAWEAASRGLSVILVEKNDFGSGTSANSLKTIHGGLRSLQRLDFTEMREYIRERRALLRIAPHLVTPLPCAIPTGRGPGNSRLLLGTGMKLYDLVACDRNRGLPASHRIPPGRLISRARLAALSPALESAGATGAACWSDAQARNPERLVLAFILSAAGAGADVYNYMKREEILTQNGSVVGIRVRDVLSGRTHELAAGSVIDCSGPWAVESKDFPTEEPVAMTRAVNLVLRRRLSDCALGLRPATGLDANRLLFIAPWREGSLAGTWYYPGSGDPDDLSLQDAELDACLRQINSLFPLVRLGRADVTLIHRGLQPAGTGATIEPKPLRDTRVIDSASLGGPRGLYWVLGVKLTTARATAVALVTTVARRLGRPVTASATHKLPLYGGSPDFGRYTDEISNRLPARWSDATRTRLLQEYGCNVDSLVRICERDPSLAEPVPGSPEAVRAELAYTLENEMTCTLSDLVLRRTGLGTLACPPAETLEYCTNFMAEYHDWDASQREMNIEELLEHYPEWNRL